MSAEDMQKALLKFASEMTSSMQTANVCIYVMGLEDDEELFNISQYLKQLIYLEQQK